MVSPRFEGAGFLAAFTERAGGASEDRYASLNLGAATGDRTDLVVENRRRVADALGVRPFACARQAHGAKVMRIGPSRAGRGFARPEDALDGVDGLATSSPGVSMAVVAADCLPIALADPGAGRIAVVHAGWRGLAAGVIQEAVRGFEDPGGLMAAIGPAIGPDHYEVGEDVALAVSAATPAGARLRRSGGRVFLDLPGTAAAILRDLGVRGIEHAETCTACQPDRFFSHRRDGTTGRQALVAVRLTR